MRRPQGLRVEPPPRTDLVGERPEPGPVDREPPMCWARNSSVRPRLLVRDKVIQNRNNYGLAIMHGTRKRHPDNRKTFVSLLVGEGTTI